MNTSSPQRWPSPLDMRMFVVLMIGFLVVANWRPDYWSIPSSSVAQFALWLKPADRTPPKVAVISVGQVEQAIWGVGATESADELLPQALAHLHDQGKVTGLVLRHPVDSFDLSSEQLQRVWDSPNEDLSQALQEQLQQQRRVHEILRSGRVVVGLSTGLTPGAEPLTIEQGALASALPLLREWLWPVPELSRLAEFPQYDLQYYPVLSQDQREQSLLYTDSQQVYVGFGVQLLNRYYASQGGESADSTQPVWYRDGGIQTPTGEYLPVSAKGAVVPLVNQYSTMAPSYARLSALAAAGRPVNSDIVLVGSRSDPSVERLAATLVGLVEGLVLVEPHWYAPLNKSLLLILLPLLLLLFPRVSPFAGLWLCGGLSAGLLAGQLAAQLFYGMWLPVADLVWTLAVGYLVVAVWQRKERSHQSADQQVQQFRLQADVSGELEQAHQTVLTGFAAGCGAADSNVGSTNDDPGAPSEDKPAAKVRNGFFKNLWARKLATPVQAPIQAPTDLPAVSHSAVAQNAVSQAQPGGAAATNLASTLVMELEGPLVLGRYEIQREIGRGAMGTVYLAYDPKIARKVAIKTLNFKHIEDPQLAEIKRRFFQEAAAAGRLNHANIVSVFDVGEEQELAYIAMDYVDGEPLSRYVTESTLLSPFEAYRIVANVARALHYAHGNNVIHRDIKPSNIMYCGEPYQLKVTDFGIARLVDDSRTSTGEILGSPLYIAPEQLQGKSLTASVDIYSLGVTFYQLLTGQLPFAGDSLASLTYDIINGKPHSVRKVRPELPLSAARIVNKALQKDVSRRYQSALEMAEAIEKAMRRDFPRDAKAAGYKA